MAVKVNHMTLICEGRCGRGRVRGTNQDNLFINGTWRQGHEDAVFCVSDRAEEGLYVVCDGMGGEQFGDEASELAVTHLQGATPSDFLRGGTEHLIAINAEICQLMMRRQARIGSTFVGLSVAGGQGRIINIGDSPAYLLRGREMTKLSCDHTRTQSLINMGIITPEEAAVHPDRHKLTQHLGIFPEEMIIEPHETDVLELQVGDVFLLCSDGLTEMLTQSEIADVLSSNDALPMQADRLYDAAMERGGKDNITLVIVSVAQN